MAAVPSGKGWWSGPAGLQNLAASGSLPAASLPPWGSAGPVPAPCSLLGQRNRRWAAKGSSNWKRWLHSGHA